MSKRDELNKIKELLNSNIPNEAISYFGDIKEVKGKVTVEIKDRRGFEYQSILDTLCIDNGISSINAIFY